MPDSKRRQRPMQSAPSPVFPSIRAALLAAALLVSAGAGRAEAPDTLWTRTYGGTNIDVGYDVQPTGDGGFVVTGYTRSSGAGGHNLWLFKTGPDGHPEWSFPFGGGSDDQGHAVRQTSDGGYIAVGFTQSSGAGGKDAWLVKTDAAGHQDWTRTFGGASDDEAYAVAETQDGGLIVAGVTSSYGAGSRDMWLIRTHADGTPVWTRTLGGYGSDGAWSVSPTSDHGFILAGWTFSYGPGYVGNAWLVKTDSLGYMEWNEALGGSDTDRGYSAIETTDGGYVLTGYTDSFGAGLYDLYLVKTDSEGTAEWSETFGGSGRDYGYSVVEAVDGGFLAAGYTLSYGAGGDDVFLVRTDAGGVLQWQATYGGTASDVANAVVNTADGGYAVVGHTLSYGAGVHDAWLIRLGSEGAPAAIESVSRAGSVGLRACPNPFKQGATLTCTTPAAVAAELRILDAAGRLMRTLGAPAASTGPRLLAWDGRDQAGARVPPGVYFCRLEAGDLRAVARIVRIE